MTYIVDTHSLIWFIEGNSRLTGKARTVMEALESDVVVPAIVLAEIAFLFGRNRIGIDLSVVLAHITETENCTIYPLDEVVVKRLPFQLNIHDGLIVATALVFRDVLGKPAAVVTKDQEIVRSGIIETVW